MTTIHTTIKATRLQLLSVLTMVIAIALMVPPMSAVPSTDLVADLLTEEAAFEIVDAPPLPDSGSHVVLHFLLENEGDQPTAVMHLVTTDNQEIMRAYVDEGTFYATNGWIDTNGEPEYAIAGNVYLTPHRVDIQVHGATYTIQVGAAEPVTLLTLNPATEATWGDVGSVQSTLPTDGETLLLPRLLFFDDDASHDAFAYPSGISGGWDVHDPYGLLSMEQNIPGSIGEGRLRVDSPLLDPRPLTGYVHTAVSGFDGTYSAHADFRPRTSDPAALDRTPDHQAVLAGLSGPLSDPHVNWALVVAPDAGDGLIHPGPLVPGWTLFLMGPDGTRTQIASTWGAMDELWQNVKVYVDEQTKTILVQVNDSQEASSFTFDALGPCDRIGTGDIWTNGDLWTGGGVGYYDNLAVASWSG